MGQPAEYDPRYVAGIVFFNRQQFFEAHEVWEDLWRDCGDIDRRFYQGLIQASVALYHGFNGNWRGARRLFHSGRAYMSAYPTPYRGLDAPAFWQHMRACLGVYLGAGEPDPAARPSADKVPSIALTPPPTTWPDPEALLAPH